MSGIEFSDAEREEPSGETGRPMSGVEWTAAEREAVTDICTHEGLGKACDRCRDTIFAALTALAPFVAARERQAAARALYRGINFAKSRAMAYNVRAGEQP